MVKNLKWEGEPQAIIRANGGIDMGAVMKSPSLALGEAYMDKTLELEKGDLFEILIWCLQNWKISQAISAA